MEKYKLMKVFKLSEIPVKTAKYFTNYSSIEETCCFYTVAEVPSSYSSLNKMVFDYFLSSGAELNETIIIDLIN